MKFIEIKLTKCIVLLTEHEIFTLLQMKPELFKEGVKRGKAVKRTTSMKKRLSKDEK